MDELFTNTADILHDEIEVQAVNGTIFIAQERTDLIDKPEISMSYAAAYLLLDWLYQRREALYKHCFASEEAACEKDVKM